MHEVPRAQRPFLALDEQEAFPLEHEEVLLFRLRVVEAVGLAGRQHMQADADLRELRLRALEAALRAGGLQLAALRRQPPGVADVDDEPAVLDRREAEPGVLESRLRQRPAP